jgi:hypothetical protein
MRTSSSTAPLFESPTDSISCVAWPQPGPQLRAPQASRARAVLLLDDLIFRDHVWQYCRHVYVGTAATTTTAAAQRVRAADERVWRGRR